MDFQFGRDLSFDTERFALQRDGQDVPMRPKAMDVLSVLVANPGRVMGKDELLAKVWPDVTVNEDSLTQCIHEIRAALGTENAELLRTVRGRGYMLDTDVTETGGPAAGAARRRVLTVTGAALAGVALLGASALWLRAPVSNNNALPIEVTALLIANETMLGQPIAYPPGTAVISSAIMTLQPGAVAGWHINSDPTLVHIFEGRVELEYADGSTYLMEPGSTFIEGIDRPHSSRALGPGPVRLLVVTLGVAGRASRQDAAVPDARSGN